jgi:hypothetical protein
MDINQENGKQDRESHAQTVRDQEKRNRESRNRNGQGRENRVRPDSARAARRMTPYEQYLQHRRKKRTGRIIFWVIIELFAILGYTIYRRGFHYKKSDIAILCLLLIFLFV